MKKIIITGGTGFLGHALEDYFSEKPYSAKILTRNSTRKKDIYWNAKDLDEWTKVLENADVLINFRKISGLQIYSSQQKTNP